VGELGLNDVHQAGGHTDSRFPHTLNRNPDHTSAGIAGQGKQERGDGSSTGVRAGELGHPAHSDGGRRSEGGSTAQPNSGSASTTRPDDETELREGK
jgi:hypothetical protein